MQKLKMKFPIALVICLNACGSIEVPQRLIDPDTGLCLERDYTYSLEYIGSSGTLKEVDFKLCQKLIGYDPITYNKVFKYLEKMRKKAQESIKK